MPLRRKISAAFAIPMIAAGVVAGVGVASAVEEHTSAVASRDAFEQVVSLQSVAMSVGEERLASVRAELGEDDGGNGAQDQLIEATDTALSDLPRFGDEVVADQVWTSLSAARSTPVGRDDNYRKAIDLLLESARSIEIHTTSAVAVDLLNDLDGLHQLVRADSNAWLAFATKTSDDLRSTAAVLDLFAVAASARADLDARTSDEPDGAIQRTLGSTAVMDNLRITALEDLLNTEQTIIAPRSALASHSDSQMRWVRAAELQVESVQAELDAVAAEAENRRNIFGAFGLLAMLVLLALALGLYQSVSTPLATAASEAQRLVNNRLSQIDEAFSRGKVSPTRPKHLTASSDDEVDQLVGTINALQDRFFDIAARETRTRQVLTGRMVTIAHRNAALLHELVRHVSSWRSADSSPEVRKRLFAIDHIATRLQRNIETGLTLGGGRSERRWIRPISAVNTVRLALGELTGFDRVDLQPMDEVRLHGIAAPDVAHVLAEIIENGLSASAELPDPKNRVTVTGEWVSSGWAFFVHDSGCGMDPDDREQINRALHTPSFANEASSRSLGFAFIGRVATRFGLDVRLLERAEGGTSARIVLPLELIDPDTVPADRKRIDAGRGVRPGEIAELPIGDAARLSAADAYFGQEHSPLEVDHDVNAELRKLIGDDAVADLNAHEDAEFGQHRDTPGDSEVPPPVPNADRAPSTSGT